MALDSTTSLSAAELAIYLVALPPTIWLLFKHGRRAFLAYLYLTIFETLRIVAGALQISAHNEHKFSASGAILDSVGLSPLLLASAGFLHELKGYRTTTTSEKQLVFIEVAVIHFGAMTGVALAAVGASNLTKAGATEADINSAHRLQEIGSVILLITWAVLGYLSFQLYRSLGATEKFGNLMVAAYPFVGIRAVYSVVYAFDHSPAVNPITGGFAIKFILIFLVQLITVMLLLSVGFLTRDIVSQHGLRKWGPPRSSRDVEFSAIPLNSPK